MYVIEAKREWEVRVYGHQLDELDMDLLVQIVIMLGRQLADEATTDGIGPADNELEE